VVLAGIPVVAGAAAAGIVVATARSDGPSRPVSPAAGSLPSTSSVAAAVLDAFERASGDILATVIQIPVRNWPVSTIRAWAYPMFPQPGQEARYRLSLYRGGRQLWDSEQVYIWRERKREGNKSVSGTEILPGIAVDYQDRTWFRGDVLYPEVLANQSPSDIRALFQSRGGVLFGMPRVVGTEELDGRRVLKLEYTIYGGYIRYLWVDARTYMLLKSVVTATDRAAGGLVPNTAVYQVLPATQANLALLTPVVPAGFTSVTKQPSIPNF
jgi:hypothetical protein